VNVVGLLSEMSFFLKYDLENHTLIKKSDTVETVPTVLAVPRGAKKMLFRLSFHVCMFLLLFVSPD